MIKDQKIQWGRGLNKAAAGLIDDWFSLEALETIFVIFLCWIFNKEKVMVCILMTNGNIWFDGMLWGIYYHSSIFVLTNVSVWSTRCYWLFIEKSVICITLIWILGFGISVSEVWQSHRLIILSSENEFKDLPPDFQAISNLLSLVFPLSCQKGEWGSVIGQCKRKASQNTHCPLLFCQILGSCRVALLLWTVVE